MALIVSLTVPEYQTQIDGEHVVMPAVTYSEAYARVIFARTFAADTWICVGWYATEESRLANENPVQLREYQTTTASLTGDVFPAMYAYLKTLEDFAGAIDHPVVDPSEVVTLVVPVEPIPEPTQPEAQA